MSFGQTPLQNLRRLDHNTFLNKPPSNGSTRDPKPLPTTSAIYGHLEQGHDADSDAPALDRFHRFKQDQTVSRPGAPKITTSPLKPGHWDFPDTSVNIAGAFNTAVNSALTSSSMNSHNQSWSSNVATSQAPKHHLGRSTSEEFEQAAASASHKRLQVTGRPGPSSSRSYIARKPLSKTTSFRNGVPDSEAEDDQPSRGQRGKSPFEDMLEVAKQAYGAASFYVKQKTSQQAEPGDSRKDREQSYDYDAEEQEYQTQTSARPDTSAQPHRRNRMSEDNRAYDPRQSEIDSESDDESDGKTRRRKKKKKEPAGTMNNLPVISADKRKKKKPKGKKGTAVGDEEEEGSESDEPSTEHQRTSLRPDTSLRHPSLPRDLPAPNDRDPNISMDIESPLGMIPEENEEEAALDSSAEAAHEPLPPQRRSVSRGPPSRIGRPLGHFTRYVIAKFFSILLLAWNLFTSLLYLSGGLTGHFYDLLLRRPFGWITRAISGPFSSLFVLGLIISGLYYQRDSLLQFVPVPRLGGKPPVYQAPEIPAANIVELAARLQAIEQALSGLSQETEKVRIRAESEGKVQTDLIGRLGLLETRVGSESRKMADVESRVREASRESLGVVRQEIDALQLLVQATQHRQAPSRSADKPMTDVEARARVQALEERVGSVEGGVKEALELGKTVITSSSNANPGAAWWNKIASGNAAKSGLIIKSSDGQDVTSLIGHLVDTAVSTYSKDTIARPDYALHSGGARIIPSLTSPTYEINPSTLRGTILGYITGNGYAIGRPPVWALHHELHNGNCWPVAGHTGQLGVALAAPIYIDEVTIDHVASEVAFDMRSAPREMELWGLVEGRDNLEKIQAWREEKRLGRENGEVVEEEPELPSTLPRAPLYVRIAEFTYDVHAPRNVQTFPVDPSLRAAGVDFGVVVLMMKSNWGREFTCLYRLRVHGKRMEEQVPPLAASQEDK